MHKSRLPIPNSLESRVGQLPAGIPTCLEPRNSRPDRKPNNQGPKCSRARGKSAVRRLATPEDQSEQRCPQQLVLGIEPVSPIGPLSEAKNRLSARYA